MDGIEQCQAEIRRLRSVVRELVSMVEPLSEIMISIADSNSDFVCSECLRTLDRLESILTSLDGDIALNTKYVINRILKRGDI